MLIGERSFEARYPVLPGADVPESRSGKGNVRDATKSAILVSDAPSIRYRSCGAPRGGFVRPDPQTDGERGLGQHRGWWADHRLCACAQRCGALRGRRRRPCRLRVHRAPGVYERPHPRAGCARRAPVWGILGFILAGVVAWWRRPESRFGLLLVLAGAVWFLSRLSSANLAVPYTVGITFDLLPAVVFLHVFLAFPSGRLERRSSGLLSRSGIRRRSVSTCSA